MSLHIKTISPLIKEETIVISYSDSTHKVTPDIPTHPFHINNLS